jgi:hypothetical protein
MSTEHQRRLNREKQRRWRRKHPWRSSPDAGPVGRPALWVVYTMPDGTIGAARWWEQPPGAVLMIGMTMPRVTAVAIMQHERCNRDKKSS